MEQLSQCPTAIQSVPLSLGVVTTEPVLCNKRSSCNEKPKHCN